MYAPTVVSIKLDSRSRDRISADALQHAIPATNETRFRALFFVAQDRILHDRCLLIEVPGGFFFGCLSGGLLLPEMSLLGTERTSRDVRS